MKTQISFVALLLCINACSPSHQGDEKDPPPHDVIPSSDLSLNQEVAFDALNTLQVNSGGHLYSTFANIQQPCYPADSSFTISRAQLLSAMEAFTEEHCKDLEPETRLELAHAAVLAQDEYFVKHCFAPLIHAHQLTDTFRLKSGTWVMPAVLDRRDVILHW